MSEVNVYKIFKQLEERKKRANPYTFYDKDELIDEILKLEDELDKYKQVLDKIKEYLEELNRDNFDFSKVKILEMIEEVYE